MKNKQELPHNVVVACTALMYLGLHGIVLTASFPKQLPRPPRSRSSYNRIWMRSLLSPEGTIKFMLAMIEADLVDQGYPLAKVNEPPRSASS